jgi:hypothetical protein
VVASFIRRISFENGDISKSILGEMRLCSRAMKWFSDRLLVKVLGHEKLEGADPGFEHLEPLQASSGDDGAVGVGVVG